MICKHFADKIFKQAWAHSSTLWNDFKYFYLKVNSMSDVNHLFAHSVMVLSIAM